MWKGDYSCISSCYRTVPLCAVEEKKAKLHAAIIGAVPRPVPRGPVHVTVYDSNDLC